MDVVLNNGAREQAVWRLANKVVAVYFSAGWCPPCQRFTPLLKAMSLCIVNLPASFINTWGLGVLREAQEVGEAIRSGVRLMGSKRVRHDRLLQAEDGRLGVPAIRRFDDRVSRKRFNALHTANIHSFILSF